MKDAEVENEFYKELKGLLEEDKEFWIEKHDFSNRITSFNKSNDLKNENLHSNNLL